MSTRRNQRLSITHIAAILSLAAGLIGILGLCGLVSQVSGNRGIACGAAAGALGIFTLVESCFSKRNHAWMFMGVS